VFCGPQFDYEQVESLTQILADYGHQPDMRHSRAGPEHFTVYHFHQGGLPVSVLDHPDARPYQPPTEAAGRTFLALLERVLEKFRPDVVLTYGGYWLAPEVIAGQSATAPAWCSCCTISPTTRPRCSGRWTRCWCRPSSRGSITGGRWG
jgi:hypothetical protein